MASTLARHYGVDFAGITLAWYRDGRDSVAPHGDRIGRLCEDTVIAIVSVGAPRRFLLHPVASGRSRIFSLGWGDLLVMGGSCQRTWLHSVPKVARADPRISVQFRAMETLGAKPALRCAHAREHARVANGNRMRATGATLRDAAALPGAAHYR